MGSSKSLQIASEHHTKQSCNWLHHAILHRITLRPGHVTSCVRHAITPVIMEYRIMSCHVHCRANESGCLIRYEEVGRRTGTFFIIKVKKLNPTRILFGEDSTSVVGVRAQPGSGISMGVWCASLQVQVSHALPRVHIRTVECGRKQKVR